MAEDKTKQQLIKQWYKQGRIKRIGSAYSVPLEAFMLGITAELVVETLKPRKRRK